MTALTRLDQDMPAPRRRPGPGRSWPFFRPSLPVSSVVADRLAWAVIVGLMLTYVGQMLYWSHPSVAGHIKVIFPFWLAKLAGWYLGLTVTMATWLLFKRAISVRTIAVMMLAIMPFTLTSVLEQIPFVPIFQTRVSTTAIHVLPGLLLGLSVLFRPRFRSVDRMVYGLLFPVLIASYVLFHFLLTIPESRLTLQRQNEAVEMVLAASPEALPDLARRFGGIAFSAAEVLDESRDLQALPRELGPEAEGGIIGWRHILRDAPQAAFRLRKPGNTVFEWIDFVSDDRPLPGAGGADAPQEARFFAFTPEAFNESMMNAQRAFYGLSSIAGAFWFIVATGVVHGHARMRANRARRAGDRPGGPTMPLD